MDVNKIKALSKILAKEQKKPEDKIIYGTVVSSDANGVVVQLDGSDSTVLVGATIEVNANDRVMVQINHHEAFVIGNVSDKSITRTTADGLINVFAHNGTFSGMLKIGGSAQNQYGVLELYDENDSKAITMDSDGLKLYKTIPGTDGIPTVQLNSDGLKISGDSEWFKYSGVVSVDYYYMSYSNSVEEVLFGTPGESGTTFSEVPTSMYYGRHITPPTSTGTKFHIASNGAETCIYSKQTPISIKSTYSIPQTEGDASTITGAEVRVTRQDLTLTGYDAIGEYTARIKLDYNRSPSPIIYFAIDGGSSSKNETQMRIDKTLFGRNVCLDTGGELHGYTSGNDEINLIAMSGSDNIVIGQTTNQSDYGDINLRAGTKSTNAINLYGKVTTSGTVSAGGTITTSGGLYTNGKTAVDDGTAGAAITTTGTIQLSASGTPYVYYRYANSTSYYTRLAASNVTANRTLTMPNSTGTLAISSSDIRVKENVKDSDVKALDLINKIKLHEFDWKEEGRGGSPHWKCGIIADELEELDAELVTGGGYFDDGSINVKSIDTLYLEGYIIKALQEISEKVDRLEAEHE